MAAADVGDVSALLDIASSPSPEPSSTPTPSPEPEVEATVTEPSTETPETGAEPTEAAAAGGDDQQKIDARTNPDAIRKALRSLRDSSPEHAPIARQLNDIVGREAAYKQVFPKVADAKQAKFILDSVGGSDGLAELQATIKSVNETDTRLYSGDGKVLDDLLSDMKSAGKGEAFGKLASPFLDRLAEHDPKAYAAALRPRVVENLVQSGLPDMLAAFDEALSAVGADGKPAPNIELIKGLVKEIQRWFNAEKSAVDGMKKSVSDPDRQAFEAERTQFQSERQKAFESEVTGDWNRVNNQALGEALKPYLKLPFAKNWTDKTKISIAREITNNLLSELSSDKTYQSQMDAFWSESKPDKSKIINYHRGKLDLMAKRVVRETLEARYPGFSSVKGAPSPNGAKKPAVVAAPAPGKPIYQTSKPKEADVDWDRDPNQLLYITGRYYDKRGIFRTWNARYK